MPRRGRSMSPSRPAPRQTAPAPAPQAQPPMMQQPKQPGMMANIASTAAGVAAGHVLASTIMGTGGHGQAAPAPQAEAAPMQQQQAYEQPSPCQLELKQFIECSQQQSDLSLCYGFNEALRECRRQSGLLQ